MNQPSVTPPAAGRPERLLATLEQLLAIDATEVKGALDRASDLVGAVLDAEKVDVFVYDAGSQALVARGVSDTPLGRLEHEVGLDRMLLRNRGRTVATYITGRSWHTGRADQDPEESVGVKETLGIRSLLVAPLVVAGERRGVLAVCSTQPEHFTRDDLGFLEAVARWTGMVLHRAELVERIAIDAAAQARQATADELVTILAHDLRAPLTPLRGWLSMLHKQATIDGHAANIQATVAMERSLLRLERIIADLLDTTRLEQDIFALIAEPVDLGALARDTAGTLSAAEGRIEVVGLAELVVECDGQRVRQALENLLTNALTHAPSSAPIMVALRAETREDGEWAILSVGDRGPGIAPELLPRLFTRFSGSRATKGLGLGLYLARGIAAAHGGTLTVESEPGQGAIFRLALPLRQEL